MLHYVNPQGQVVEGELTAVINGAQKAYMLLRPQVMSNRICGSAHQAHPWVLPFLELNTSP